MRAMWVSAAAALFVLLAQAPAWSMTHIIGIPVKHHVYGHIIHGIVINRGHKIFGIIIVHPGGVKNPIGVPPVTTKQ